MKAKIMILMVVIILVFSGCQGKEEVPTDSKKTEIQVEEPNTEGKESSKEESEISEEEVHETVQEKPEEAGAEEGEAVFSLYEIFPSEKGFTWYYDGALDYGRYETIVNVEETLKDERAKYIYVEGEVDDLSGGEAGDLSFIKKYKVTDDSIEYMFEDDSFSILKVPLKKGNSWTDIVLDETKGFFNARVTIIDISDNTITTEIIPESPMEDAVDPKYKIVTKYEIGKGVVSTNTTYPQLETEDTYEFPIRLSKISQIAPKNFIAKYVEPDKSLAKFYRHENTWYQGIVAKEKQWINNEKSNLNEEVIISRYKDLLENLSKQDIRSISIAEKIALLYCDISNETDGIIRLFEGFYEELIPVLDEEFVMSGYIPYDEINQMFIYDVREEVFKNILPSEDGKIFDKAVILYENGLSMTFQEGMPFLVAEPDYVIRSFENLASEKMKDYLKQKKWGYKNTPLISDGALRVTWKELSNQIIALEEMNKKYPETIEGDWAKTEADNLFKLYAVPMALPNTPKYWNGILSESLKESYEEFIEKQSDSDYSKVIDEIYQNLQDNHFGYNMDLDKLLRSKGFNPLIEEFVFNRIKERSKQIEDFKKIQLRAEEKIEEDNEELEIITVDTVEKLIESIGPNRKILIKSGAYIFPYLPTDNQSEFVNIQYGQVNISNVDNLIIEGLGETPVTLLSEANGFVFSFKGSENISLVNLRLGHTKEYCIAGVVEISGKNIKIDKSILFGCGEWGITATGVENLQVTNTLISDCATQAVQLFDSKDVTFENCIFTRNGKNAVQIETSKDVLFKKVDITNNTKENYYNAISNAVFYLKQAENITLESSVVNENGFDKMSDGDSELVIKE